MKDISKIIHSKSYKKDAHGSLRMPIYDSASFEFESAEDIEMAFNGEKPAHIYSRSTNPTVEYFEKQVRDFTGSFAVLALSSGMAAITNITMLLCGAGDNIVTSPYLFGNTYSLFKETLKPWGLETRFVDFSKPESIEDSIDEKTKFIFLETVTNPQLQVADLKAISAVARKKNVLLVVDSTITPFAFGNMKNLGVDIEVLSSTKYLSGGATSVGGLIIDYKGSKIGDIHLMKKLRKTVYRDFGSCLSPHSAYLQSLGLETFMMRARASADNAKVITDFMNGQKKVIKASYPENTEQFNGIGGGLMTFELDSKEACFAFINALKMIRKATNLNDNKTLIIHPSSTIYCEYSDEEKEAMSVGDGLIRLAVGIEEPEDIIEDLKKGLDAIG